MPARPAPIPAWALSEPAPWVGVEVLAGAELDSEVGLGGSVVLPTEVLKPDDPVDRIVVPG